MLLAATDIVVCGPFVGQRSAQCWKIRILRFSRFQKTWHFTVFKWRAKES